MKSKEEILQESQTESILDGQEHEFVTVNEALQAMDIFANQEAISFAEWCDADGWRQVTTSGSWYNAPSHKYLSSDRFTTYQLYEMYQEETK